MLCDNLQGWGEGFGGRRQIYTCGGDKCIHCCMTEANTILWSNHIQWKRNKGKKNNFLRTKRNKNTKSLPIVTQIRPMFSVFALLFIYGFRSRLPCPVSPYDENLSTLYILWFKVLVSWHLIFNHLHLSVESFSISSNRSKTDFLLV